MTFGTPYTYITSFTAALSHSLKVTLSEEKAALPNKKYAFIFTCLRLCTFLGHQRLGYVNV